MPPPSARWLTAGRSTVAAGRPPGLRQRGVLGRRQDQGHPVRSGRAGGYPGGAGPGIGQHGGQATGVSGRRGPGRGGARGAGAHRADEPCRHRRGPGRLLRHRPVDGPQEARGPARLKGRRTGCRPEDDTMPDVWNSQGGAEGPRLYRRSSSMTRMIFARPTLAALTLAAGMLSALVAPPAEAQVYKWVDEKGVVNYGSEPPPGRPVKELPKDGSGISVVPAPPPPPPSAPRSRTDERIERLEEALAAERAARAAEEQAAEDKLRAAIAECERNHGIDCAQNPYQYAESYGGYVHYPPVRRPIVRHGPDGMPVPKPLPAHQGKPPPKPPARTGPAASHPTLPWR